MAKNQNNQQGQFNSEFASETNVQKVRKQNQQSASQGQFNTEFASETDVQEVRKQNQQSEAKKMKNSGNMSSSS